jgi:hypothetical protein
VIDGNLPRKADGGFSEPSIVRGQLQEECRVSQAYSRTQGEQWPMNATIHYNEWLNNLQEHEFRPVVQAFKDLLTQFGCTQCDTYLHVLPQRGSSLEELRCDCGKVSFNLKRKEGKS